MDASVPFNSVTLERKIHFLNAPSLGRFSEFRLGTPVPSAVHGNLRTIDHFFLLNVWFLPASACRRISVNFPYKAHPAADWQGATDKISGNLKKARGRLLFYHFMYRRPSLNIVTVYKGNPCRTSIHFSFAPPFSMDLGVPARLACAASLQRIRTHQRSRKPGLWLIIKIN
jgi:hypothetical protein